MFGNFLTTVFFAANTGVAEAAADAAPVTDTVEQVTNLAAMGPGNLIDYILSGIPALGRFGVDVIAAILIYLVGSRVIRLVMRIVRRMLIRSSKVQIEVRQFLVSLITTILYAILIVAIASRFGVTTASILALLGTIGLAFGLALQGSLANLAGGVLILVLKPFKVGDYIIEHLRGSEGTVTEIHIFYTKLATPDGKVIVIPNGTLSNNSLTNAGTVER